MTLPLPELGHVDVWSLHIPDFLNQYTQWRLLLTADEQARAARFIQPLHQQRFIIARAGLRQLLARYLNISPIEIALSSEQQGKPILKNPAYSLHFNISHSADAVLYAIAQHTPLGVDIEKQRADISIDIAARFFSPAENMTLDATPSHEKTQMFYRIWTGKEAVIKMTGEGLFSDLTKFSVNATEITQTILLPNGCHAYLQFLLPAPGYAAALASGAPIKKISLRHF